MLSNRRRLGRRDVHHSSRLSEESREELSEDVESQNDNNEEEKTEHTEGTKSKNSRKKRQQKNLGHRKNSNMILGIVMAIVMSIVGIYFGFPKSSTSKKKIHKTNQTKVQTISMHEAYAMYDEGIRLIKAFDYKKAEPILRTLKVKLEEKRSSCQKGTKEYNEVEKLLEKTSESHYHAYKNIKLK